MQAETSKVLDALTSLGRPVVVVVTGGRAYSDYEMVATALGVLHSKFGIARLGHGKAKGADTLAGAWAKLIGIPVKEHPANWDAFGKRAGFIRNAEMLDTEKPDVVVAFPGGNGTADCVKSAKLREHLVWDLRFIYKEST